MATRKKKNVELEKSIKELPQVKLTTSEGTSDGAKKSGHASAFVSRYKKIREEIQAPNSDSEDSDYDQSSETLNPLSFNLGQPKLPDVVDKQVVAKTITVGNLAKPTVVKPKTNLAKRTSTTVPVTAEKRKKLLNNEEKLTREDLGNISINDMICLGCLATIQKTEKSYPGLKGTAIKCSEDKLWNDSLHKVVDKRLGMAANLITPEIALVMSTIAIGMSSLVENGVIDVGDLRGFAKNNMSMPGDDIIIEDEVSENGL